tara:strand:- start:378 stop:515 length:138 start_codon:yes stop_codon:yes gene_type:complete
MLLQLLNIDKFYGISETMEIAKGKNKIPMTIKEGYEQIKRKIKWQ